MEKSFERDVLDRLTKIEAKLDDYNKIKSKLETVNISSINNSRELEELKDKFRWLSRTFIGALITGMIGLIIGLLKVGGIKWKKLGVI